MNSRNNSRTRCQQASRFHFDSLEPKRLLATLADAGISQRVIDYVGNLEASWPSLVLNDQGLQNTLKDIIESKVAPTDAQLITSESEFSQIQSGGTYLIKGDLTVTQTFQVPSNVTIYVDGSIYKQGAVVANNVHDLENYDDAIFGVRNSDNVNLIGVNNALLHSNPDLAPTSPHASAIIVEGNASNVHIEGFEIANVWEGVIAFFGTSNVSIENNYIHDTVGRAIWFLGTTNTAAAHNFVENAGVDGIDFDAFTADSTAYENVIIGSGRWAGFVEEGANNNFLVRGMAIMADFGNPNSGYQMGWADNGTSPFFTANNPDLITRDNYFVDNVVFRPTSFADGGEYFAKTGPDTEKGPTYFWANRGYGAGQSTTLFQNAEWLEENQTAAGTGGTVNGVKILDDLNIQFNEDAQFVDIIDFEFTTAEGFTAGGVNGQQGFVGQAGTIVDPAGAGTITASGGPYFRNAYGTDLLTAVGQTSLAAGDRIKFTVDYQFTLSGFTSIDGAKFGLIADISNFGDLTPQEGFEIKFDAANAATGGSVRLIGGDTSTNLPAFDFGLDPNGDNGIVDLASDPLQVTYEIESDGAGNFIITNFEVLNAKTGIRTELPVGPSFTFAGVPHYSQGLALNGDTGFTGVSDGVQIEFSAVPDAVVMGRHVHYNNSSFDGDSSAADASDNVAIAPDKLPLYPGGTATLANYTSFHHGINGIMVDIADLANAPTVDDFEFRVGNSNTLSTWTTAVDPVSVTVRTGDGVGGSDRVTLAWTDSAITNQWLQVRVLANANTGIAADDVFYFGSVIGESGNSPADAIVNIADIAGTRSNQTGFGSTDILNKFDFNRDAKVNIVDLAIARINQSGFTPVNLITPTGGSGFLANSANGWISSNVLLGNSSFEPPGYNNPDDELNSKSPGFEMSQSFNLVLNGSVDQFGDKTPMLETSSKPIENAKDSSNIKLTDVDTAFSVFQLII